MHYWQQLTCSKINPHKIALFSSIRKNKFTLVWDNNYPNVTDNEKKLLISIIFISGEEHSIVLTINTKQFTNQVNKKLCNTMSRLLNLQSFLTITGIIGRMKSPFLRYVSTLNFSSIFSHLLFSIHISPSSYFLKTLLWYKFGITLAKYCGLFTSQV